jgi:hypothetical protein
MLALVRNRGKFVTRLFFLASLSLLGACATQKQPPHLVSDPTSKAESPLPWNKQEQWEIGGGIPAGALGESR